MKPSRMGIGDPTYTKEWIDSNPVWKLAFELSEYDNDNAPIGWGQYINLARLLLIKYELLERRKDEVHSDRM